MVDVCLFSKLAVGHLALTNIFMNNNHLCIRSLNHIALILMQDFYFKSLFVLLVMVISVSDCF